MPDEEQAAEVQDQDQDQDQPDRGDEFEPDDTPEDMPEDEADLPDEDDEPAEQAAPEPAKPAEDEPLIPKARFDEVNAKMREYKARLDAADGAGQPAAITDKAKSLQDAVKAKVKEYHAAMNDVEFDKASVLLEEVTDLQMQLADERARAVYAHERQAVAIESYRQQIAERETEIATAHPWLLKGDPNHDPGALQDFELIRDGYLARNPGRNVEAMNTALEKVLKMRGVVMPPPTKSKQQHIAAKLAAASKQPPRHGGVSNRAAGSSAPTKVSTLSDDEFRALSPAEKKALRGDKV
jgi:hypothetical protein